MNREALEKIFRKSNGRVPHLAPENLQPLLNFSSRFQNSRARFWGVVDARHKLRDSNVLHCFNFGNTSVKFPWRVEAVNFGVRVPMLITGSGNVKAFHTYRTLLHQVEAPFLVFAYAEAAMAEERLQSGFVITNPGTAEMVREREIVLLDRQQPPADGILYYYLMKRISFRARPMDDYTPRGDQPPMTRFKMELNDPMLLEPGWIVLMLERDRWLWGVVIK